MQFWKVISALLYVSLISGCVVAPKVADRQVPKDKCELITKKLELDLKKSDMGCGGNPEEVYSCLVFVGAIVVPISAVVSGSIVLVGNTLHWAEKEMSCPKNNEVKEVNKSKPEKVSQSAQQ